MDRERLITILRNNVDPTIASLNEALLGKGLEKMEPVLTRIGRGGKIPYWFNALKANKTLPNLDGKTIGSVVEMLLVAVLETNTFAKENVKLRVNPARGTDLPDLDLGIKSPSTNYCTSEPFFSAYERLIGSPHDALILLTDYQEKKEHPPLKLQILKHKYLQKSEIADENLCKVGLVNRSYLLGKDEIWAQKVFRFLAYVNQSDWLAKQLIQILYVLQKPDEIKLVIAKATKDFTTYNRKAEAKNSILLPDVQMDVIKSIADANPYPIGIIDAVDSWVIENLQDAARMPSPSEWKEIKSGPLNGKIGMSFALQWRFNFGRVFGKVKESEADGLEPLPTLGGPE